MGGWRGRGPWHSPSSDRTRPFSRGRCRSRPSSDPRLRELCARRRVRRDHESRVGGPRARWMVANGRRSNRHVPARFDPNARGSAAGDAKLDELRGGHARDRGFHVGERPRSSYGGRHPPARRRRRRGPLARSDPQHRRRVCVGELGRSESRMDRPSRGGDGARRDCCARLERTRRRGRHGHRRGLGRGATSPPGTIEFRTVHVRDSWQDHSGPVPGRGRCAAALVPRLRDALP